MDWLAQPEWLVFLFAVATVAGFVDTLAGGGGLLTLPALLLAQVPPVAALATNKLQASFGTLTASYRMLRSGLVQWQRLKWLVVVSAVGSGVGTVIVQQVDPAALEVLIPVVLLIIALYYLLVRNPGEAAEPRISETAYKRYVVGSIGFYDGFFGPGTGSLFAFTRNALRGESLLDSTALAKVLNFASNIASLVLFAVGGHMVWLVGVVMIAGQIIGATVASHLIIGGKTAWIRSTIVLVCIAMAIRALVEQL